MRIRLSALRRLTPAQLLALARMSVNPPMTPEELRLIADECDRRLELEKIAASDTHTENLLASCGLDQEFLMG